VAEDCVHALCSKERRVDRMKRRPAGPDRRPVVSDTDSIVCAVRRTIVEAKREHPGRVH
jgi:hypothetical protein